MKYQKTNDPKKMLTNRELDEIIQNDWENIKEFLPCRTATYIEHEAGATEALVWNEGETEKTKIKLPLEDGWYLPDEIYGIPNGEKSAYECGEARYLWRYQNIRLSGYVTRGHYDFGDNGRYVGLYDRPSDGHGVEKVEDNLDKDILEILKGEYISPDISMNITNNNHCSKCNKDVPTWLRFHNGKYNGKEICADCFGDVWFGDD